MSAFIRTRAGETVSLMPIVDMDDQFEIGQGRTYQEVEEINRRGPLPSFETNIVVRKNPQFDTLCKDTYYYPVGMVPEVYPNPEEPES